MSMVTAQLLCSRQRGVQSIETPLVQGGDVYVEQAPPSVDSGAFSPSRPLSFRVGMSMWNRPRRRPRS